MSPWILVILIAIPALAALVVAFSPASLARTIAAGATLLAGAVGVWALAAFDWTQAAAFQGAGALSWLPALGIELSVGVDSVALLLVALTLLLGPVVVFGSFSAIGDDDRPRTYYGWLLALQAAMTGVFCARDLILFFICFEFTLIPMWVLINLYGSSNRKAAATKFFLFTFTGSIITLAGLVYIAWFNAARLDPVLSLSGGEWTFDIAALREAAVLMGPAEQGWILLAMMIGFAVKVPLFPVHTWLPLAHTEAPTAGSVILAGVLLKLGTYGIYRFVLPFAPGAVVEFAPLIAVLSIIGIIYAGLICWVQEDVKKLVAYSSVSHLGFCVLGLVALNSLGVSGSVLYMVNHGLSTGALFLLIGMVYERYHTRDMKQIGGLAKTMPLWSTFMVFFVLASVALPGLNGFVSEFLCLIGAFQRPDGFAPEGAIIAPGRLGPIYAGFAGLGMIIAAMYLLYMTGRVVWGAPVEPAGHHPHPTLPRDLSGREIAVLLPLAVPCLVIGLYPKPLLRALEAPVNDTVEWVWQKAPPEALLAAGVPAERIAGLAPGEGGAAVELADRRREGER